MKAFIAASSVQALRVQNVFLASLSALIPRLPALPRAWRDTRMAERKNTGRKRQLRSLKRVTEMNAIVAVSPIISFLHNSGS